MLYPDLSIEPQKGNRHSSRVHRVSPLTEARESALTPLPLGILQWLAMVATLFARYEWGLKGQCQNLMRQLVGKLSYQSSRNRSLIVLI